MIQSKENKLKQGWLLLLKLSIAIGALLFIYFRVFQKEHISEVLSHIQSAFADDGSKFLIAAVLLMLLNWSAEAIKWKLLIGKIEQVTFLKSINAVFAGLTISFFTPNRIGEYAGRVIFLHRGNRIRGALLTVLENMSQLIVTVVLGMVCLPFFLLFQLKIPFLLFLLLLLFATAFSALIVVFFLRMESLNNVLFRFSFFKKYERFVNVCKEAKPLVLIQLLGISFVRYVIFSGQLFLLLLAFGLSVSYLESISLITLTFFAMTVIPSFAFADIGIRGAAATFFFSYITADLTPVVYSTVALWLINLVLPAVIGALVLVISAPERSTAS